MHERQQKLPEGPRDRRPAARGNGANGRPDPGREAWLLLLGLLRAERGSFVAAIGDLDLTPVQARLLLDLEPERPVAMNELANALYCDASNITGLVDKLESRKLIERRAGADDRRVKMIAVTKLGVRLRATLRSRISQPPQSIASLSESEKKSLRDILRKALDNRTPASALQPDSRRRIAT
jgi:MarR family transcriptional regulator, organic hydroperoxide resistance regulator